VPLWALPVDPADAVDPVPVDPAPLPALLPEPPPDERRALARTNCSLPEALDLPSDPVPVAEVEPPAVDPAPLLVAPLLVLPAVDVPPLLDVPDVLLVPDICIRHPDAVTLRSPLPLCPVLAELLCAYPIVVLAQMAMTAAPLQMKLRFMVPPAFIPRRDAARPRALIDIVVDACSARS
jgi:hypothetical protein